jgi:Flp pilus assembly pilin Flp
MSCISLLRRFGSDTRGVAAIEFALLVPIATLMLLGVLEICNYLLANQRTEKMAHTISDVVTQADSISVSEIKSILGATDEIMKPFPFSKRGHVVITSVHRNVGEGPEVAWQYEGGGSRANSASKFGTLGKASPLPAGFTINERETVIITEVYYDYPPLVTKMFSDNPLIYKYAFYKPRLGALDSLQQQ